MKNGSKTIENYILCVLIAMCGSGIIFMPKVYAQGNETTLPLKIITHYEEMEATDRYLEIKRLAEEKRALNAIESDRQDVEQIDAEIGIIMNSLRSALFRQKQSVYDLQKLRHQLFGEFLARRQAEYEASKCSDKPGEILRCDALFSQMQKLEIKVYKIEDEMRHLEIALFKERSREKAFILLEKLDRVHPDDLAGKVAIKREMLLLIQEVAVILQYPTDALARIESEIKNVNDFIATYSYWDATQDKNDEDMVNVYKTPYEDELPTEPWDDSEMVGRRNYMDTVVKKENDMRKGTKVNVRSIQDSAPQSTLGINVKEKIMARDK
jgi:hypothetical protein